MRNINRGVTATVFTQGTAIKAVLDFPLAGFISQEPVWFGVVGGKENSLIRTPTEPQDDDRVLVQQLSSGNVGSLAITHLL